MTHSDKGSADGTEGIGPSQNAREASAEERLENLELPPTPRLPPPPQVVFHPPVLGRPARTEDDEPYRTTVRIGADRPRGTPPPHAEPVGYAASWGAGLGAGISFAAAVIVGVIVGQWLDRRFHCAPWGTVGFVLAGLAAGFFNLFRLLGAEDRARKQPPK